MFLRTGAFFSSILSEFLKNLVALQEDMDILKRLYLYGETYEEICEDLGLKKSALAMRVKRSKELFRKNYFIKM